MVRSDDNVFNSYVDYNSEYITPREIPTLGVYSFKVDPKRIEKEEQEIREAIIYQIKKGILKMPPKPTILSFKTGDIGKIHVNPAIVTKIKNIDLFQPCPCGSGQDLVKCHLKEIMSRAK